MILFFFGLSKLGYELNNFDITVRLVLMLDLVVLSMNCIS